MDLGKPLIEYGQADISVLLEEIMQLPSNFWEIDKESRVKLAGNRPGNAVFFYNDLPSFVNRPSLLEAKTGYISVMRYSQRPLFQEIQQILENVIMPAIPDCDVMRVQLAELPPGQTIKPHKDVGILAAVHRLHIPIITHKDVKFIIENQTFFLEEGMLYDLNNTVIHSVENKSQVNRFHLLIDMLPRSIARARYFDDEDKMKKTCLAFQIS